MLAFSLCRTGQLPFVTCEIQFYWKINHVTGKFWGSLSGLLLIKMSSILAMKYCINYSYYYLLPQICLLHVLFINKQNSSRELRIFGVFCSGMDVKAYLRSMIPHLESGMKTSKSKDMYVLNILKYYKCISILEVSCCLCIILILHVSRHGSLLT